MDHAAEVAMWQGEQLRLCIPAALCELLGPAHAGSMMETEGRTPIPKTIALTDHQVDSPKNGRYLLLCRLGHSEWEYGRRGIRAEPQFEINPGRGSGFSHNTLAVPTLIDRTSSIVEEAHC